MMCIGFAVRFPHSHSTSITLLFLSADEGFTSLLSYDATSETSQFQVMGRRVDDEKTGFKGSGSRLISIT